MYARREMSRRKGNERETYNMCVCVYIGKKYERRAPDSDEEDVRGDIYICICLLRGDVYIYILFSKSRERFFFSHIYTRYLGYDDPAN